MDLDTLYKKLDGYFNTIDKAILTRQDPVTGLLPASTAVNAHGDYTDAWVRDNVYSILSVWGLGLAYRRLDPNHYRTYALNQSVVKLMRGLLIAMMRQSDRVEAFKVTLDPSKSLHAKYGTSTGLPVVGDEEWGHLQIDATSLFLLMLAQMTASGLRIVFTLDEVNFVQNLVHYISRAYCTPDYGIWERGHKINTGITEINCSSVGMAKAALQAMSGFNLFGNVASQDAKIHVVPSDVSRSRTTLKGLLPRESNSKETDAALLSIIGFPAYAIEDEALVEETRTNILQKLGGRYGCKRFLLDGHQSLLEDSSRLHYEGAELRQFEHIESEWPLFFTYLLLDALLRDDHEAVEHWRTKLEPLFVEQDGERLLPELYYVPLDSIEAEKAMPGSQARRPNENLPLVWAQSLYLLSDMIIDGLLRPADIDPLQRREAIGRTRRIHTLIPVLAENENVQEQLANLGFNSETPEQVKPVRILHARQLSKVHAQIGINSKLGLSGRPILETRTATTSRLHRLYGEEIIFLPYYFNPRGFYFSYDANLLVEQFRSSIRVLGKNWQQPGQPVIAFLVRESMLTEENRKVVLKLLNEFQNGECESTPVKTGPLAQLLTTASVERIDHLHGYTLKDSVIGVYNHVIKHRPCVSQPQSLSARELDALESGTDSFLINTLETEENPHARSHALAMLWQRHGAEFQIRFFDQTISLSELGDRFYDTACTCENWGVVRHLAETLGKSDERLEDVLLDIVMRQKRLAVGRSYSEKATFSEPTNNADIISTITEFCGNNTAENVLTQEILLHLGHLLRSDPQLFDSLLTLRTWYMVQLLVGQISRQDDLPISDAYQALINLPPSKVFSLLRYELRNLSTKPTQLADQESLHIAGELQIRTIGAHEMPENGDAHKDWAQWRIQTGMVGLLPEGFYKKVWHMLSQCDGLVIGDKYSVKNRIGSELTLETTAGERSFDLRIDSLLQGINAPDYRQLNIEVIEALANLLSQNPDIKISNDLVLDVVIGHAVRIAWKKNHDHNTPYEEQKGLAWQSFYTLSPGEARAAFIEATLYLVDMPTQAITA